MGINKRNKTKEIDMRLLIISIIVTVIGLLLWFLYPPAFAELFGVRVILKDLAPVIAGLGVIGIIVAIIPRVR